LLWNRWPPHFGRKRRLVDADHPRTHLLQRPTPAARAAAEIEADIARAGAPADQGQCLPQLQIGPARRPAAVFDKADFAIREQARTVWRGEQCVGVEQGPGTERRARRRRAELQRLRRYDRQLRLDQHRAAMELRRIDHPIALDRAQFLGRVADRLDVDLDRIEPDILRPGRRLCRAGGDQQAVMR